MSLFGTGCHGLSQGDLLKGVRKSDIYGVFCMTCHCLTLRCGRSERIRTSDPCVPNAVLYQAELHSDSCVSSDLSIYRSLSTVKESNSIREFLNALVGKQFNASIPRETSFLPASMHASMAPEARMTRVTLSKSGSLLLTAVRIIFASSSEQCLKA